MTRIAKDSQGGRGGDGSVSDSPGQEGAAADSGQRDVPREFRDGLESLEARLDEALREAGGRSALSLDEGPVVAAAESLLDFYAHLRRTIVGPAGMDMVGALSSGDAADLDRDTAFEQALSPLLRFLYRRWWRVDLRGLEHVPSEGPVVLVANSSGGLVGYDGAMLRFGVRESHPAARGVRPLLDEALMNLPVTGDLLARCGAVLASEDNGDALLARGAAVACFPEGRGVLGREFQQRYRLGHFSEAWFIRMALRVDAPIVPVAIVGAEEVHPVLAKWDWLARQVGVPFVPVTPTFPLLGLGGLVPLPSRWRIEVGRPIELPRSADGDSWEDSRLVRRAAGQVRRRLQALLDSAVTRRGSAFCSSLDSGRD